MLCLATTEGDIFASTFVALLDGFLQRFEGNLWETNGDSRHSLRPSQSTSTTTEPGCE